jgi:GNAT superfamily N-acetyltransferase
MSEIYMTRMATVEDAEIITGHRRAMFEDMRMNVPDLAMKVFNEWVKEKLIRGDYLGWFITREDGKVVAGAGLWLIEWPPTPIDADTVRGYVLNVFVEPDYRHQGLARRLMDVVLAYSTERKLRVVTLHASSKGRPLYEALGFRGTNEMRIVLEYDN